MATGSWVAEHGMFASWQKLIDAEDKFIELCNAQEWEAARDQWDNVVREAQRCAPVHVVNEYFHPTRSFVPCPDFKDVSPLPRRRITNTGVDWFEWLKSNPGAFIRYPCSWHGPAGLVVPVGGGGLFAAAYGGACDREALVTLLEIREAQCNQLFTDYLGSECTSRIKFKS